MTDLAALIQVARDDLEDVRSRLDDLYEDIFAREWQPGSGRSASGHRSRVLFDPTQLPVRQAWDDAQREIGKADQLLRDHTTVPASAMIRTGAGERTPLADLSGSQISCVILDGMLAWVAEHLGGDIARAPRGRTADPARTEAAIREACEHVGAARERALDLTRLRAHDPKPPRRQDRCLLFDAHPTMRCADLREDDRQTCREHRGWHRCPECRQLHPRPSCSTVNHTAAAHG